MAGTMKKIFQKKNVNMKPSMSAQILSAFAFAAVLALAFAGDAGSDAASSVPQVHARWKRSLQTDLFDTAEKLGIGGNYIKKFRKLLEGTPPTVKDAFIEGDFSNITENDIRGMNVSVLEFVPPNLLSKMADKNLPLIMPFIQKFLDFNRPNALGRLMSTVGDKFDTNTLLNEINERGEVGTGGEKNEAAGVLLYSALNKIGDKGGLTTQNLRRLATDNLLDLVPEEQLMKVKDSNAAKYLLDVYSKKSGDELDDVDDKAVIYQLANAAYGEPSDWTSGILKSINSKILSQLPSSALKKLSPSVIEDSISIFRNNKLESPLQGKAVADSFLQSKGLKEDEDGSVAEAPANMGSVLNSLGSLAAFVKPSLAKESSSLGLIMNACEKLNLPAPFQAVTRYISAQTKGKRLEDLGVDDVKSMGIAAIKNGPPQLVDAALRTESLSESDLRDIGNVRPELGGIGNSFLQGIISQVAGYAVKYFTRGGKIDFGSLPGAFLGALGIKGVNNIRDDRDLDDALAQLKKNPDAMDDAQKALLLKRLKESGKLNDLPPELAALFSRKSITTDIPEGILDGLPSDSELRLAHGMGKNLRASDLIKDPLLIGTMTPAQAKEFDLSEIPAVLAAVRKSRDGPQPQTLKALAVRFREYIQQKSEDYESEDKKLLKHISAAEISKLPASVLAYFVDPKQTKKLPADVRKEIMIALGELSTKDHAGIPSKTREEIILQGLAALDEKLDKEKKLGVPELAAIGAGVADLPPARIESLTPVAVEQALEIVNGMSDEDDDGLKQRACLSKEQRKAWRNKLVQIYGDVDSWDPATVTSLCCSLAFLEEEELTEVPRDSIMGCRCPADDDPPSHLKELKKSLDANCKHESKVEASAHKKSLENVKAEHLNLDDLESQIIAGRRRKKRDVKAVNCYMIRLTGSPAPFEKEELETLEVNDIHNCLYELGKEPLSKDVARVLWDKLVKSQGGVENIGSSVYTYAGHILSGIRLEEIPKLNVSDPDILSSFGKPLGFTKTTLEKIAHQYEEKARKEPVDFTSADLVAMKNILCGFSPSKLREIKSPAFIEALPVLKDLDGNCELTRLATLAETLTREDIYGDVSKWTSADVRGAGILLIGVDKVENIPGESFLGLTPTVAAALPETILSSLTAEQVGYFPRFSAQTLSEEQLSKLSGDAKQALDVHGPLVTGASVICTVSFTTYLTLAISAVIAQRIL